MSDWTAKRFWKKAEAAKTDTGFAVLLDGRAVKTPGKQALEVPTKALAEALALEWDAQDEKIDPESMPLTRLTNSTIDKVTKQQSAVALMLAEYGGSDLLCYRAEQPEKLVQRQAEAWDDLLAWTDQQHGITLQTQTGLMPIAQSAESRTKIEQLTLALDPFELTAFHELVTLSGSWVIGYAALTKTRSPESLWDLTLIDEYFQEEQWGKDEEALAMRAVKRTAFLTGHTFAVLCHSA